MRKVGENLAAEICGNPRKIPRDSALVLALSGELGAGKTTFLQGFARGLGIAEVVNSPTFVIMKKFEIVRSPTPHNFKNFYHFDLYRLEDQKDFEFFNSKEILADPKNIVAIEWPKKIASMLPKEVISINFIHKNSTERVLNITGQGL